MENGNGPRDLQAATSWYPAGKVATLAGREVRATEPARFPLDPQVNETYGHSG